MNGPDASLFLVWHGAPGAEVTLGDQLHPLSDQMMLVRSERTLSKIYHAVKRQLPEGTALCVSPLAAPPKFKGLAPGALAWLRAGA